MTDELHKQAEAIAWTLNDKGPGAYRSRDGSLFILSAYTGQSRTQVVELEEYERLQQTAFKEREAMAEELAHYQDLIRLYKMAGDAGERAQALRELLDMVPV